MPADHRSRGSGADVTVSAVHTVTAAAAARLFAPERPGPMIYAHITTTGLGRCRADRTREPRTALAELPGGNVACRGEPVVVPDLRGFVEAPAGWVPEAWVRTRRSSAGSRPGSTGSRYPQAPQPGLRPHGRHFRSRWRHLPQVSPTAMC